MQQADAGEETLCHGDHVTSPPYLGVSQVRQSESRENVMRGALQGDTM